MPICVSGKESLTFCRLVNSTLQLYRPVRSVTVMLRLPEEIINLVMWIETS